MEVSKALVLATVALASTVAGCSSENADQGVPTAVPQHPVTQVGVAPRAPSQLPTPALGPDPCVALLSPQGAYMQGLRPIGEPFELRDGVGCKWVSDTSEMNKLAVSVMTGWRNGLDDVYALRSRSQYFEPTTIEGFPAVRAGGENLRGEGSKGSTCQTWVGINDHTAISIQPALMMGSNVNAPCPVSDRIAGGVVRHLKGEP